VDVAIAICEDLWQDGGPVAACRRAGAALLVVPNASPYERGKDDVRLDLCVRRAREAGAALAYANMIGGQDELVFDGDSILVAADGALIARGPQFDEALVVADLDLPAAGPGQATGDEPVDAGDGTVITIRRGRLSPRPGWRAPGGGGGGQGGRRRLGRAGPTSRMGLKRRQKRRRFRRSSGPRGRGCSGIGCPIRPKCTRRWGPGA